MCLSIFKLNFLEYLKTLIYFYIFVRICFFLHRLLIIYELLYKKLYFYFIILFIMKFYIVIYIVYYIYHANMQ